LLFWFKHAISLPSVDKGKHVFRRGKQHGEADEAAGLTPGNEENEVRRCFHIEKPYLPLSIDGSKKILKLNHIGGGFYAS